MEENGIVLGEYVYNGFGQRVIKTVDGVSTVFHYGMSTNADIIGESDLDGVFTKEYLYSAETGRLQRLAMVDVASGEAYFYVYDHLGIPIMLVDPKLKVVWYGIYRPFGEAMVDKASRVVNNFRFPGQYFDTETGLHYNYHRYYDPSIGRYLTPDPLGISGGNMNPYLYAQSNPVNSIDPLGLYSVSIFQGCGTDMPGSVMEQAVRFAMADLRAAAASPEYKRFLDSTGTDPSIFLTTGGGPRIYLGGTTSSVCPGNPPTGEFRGCYLGGTNQINIQCESFRCLVEPWQPCIPLVCLLAHEIGHYQADRKFGSQSSDEFVKLFGCLPKKYKDKPNPKEGPWGYAAELWIDRNCPNAQ